MKIGVDLDEVLAEFLHSFLRYHNDHYHTKFKREDFFSYNFIDVADWTREEMLQKIYEFQQTDAFMHMKPVEGALSVLQRLKSENHEIYIITSRQDYIQVQTKDRVALHYPNIFKDIYFTNDYSLRGPSRNKSDICDELGIELMIDDSLKYAEDCAKGSREVLLYNQPRNQSKPLSPNIQRVQNRKEINYLI